MRSFEDEFERLCTNTNRKWSLYKILMIIPENHPQDAEDVLQTAYLRAWDGLSGFREQSSLRTWFERIIERTALNHRRSISRQPFFVNADQIDMFSRHDWMDPYHHTACAEKEALRREAMRVFPAHYATVIEMRRDGLTFREIATLNDFTEYQAKRAFHSALEVLRENLTARGWLQ